MLITPLLSRINSVPASTLKLNAKLLRDKGLIMYSKKREATLTDAGKLVLDIIGDKNEK